MTSATSSRDGVSASVAAAPIVGVVRTSTTAEALRQARAFAANGVELVEVTFSVPEATDVVRKLLAERDDDGPPWIGMGTVTGEARAHAALEAGAEFLVSPNPSEEVARVGKAAGTYLFLGALTPGEIVTASNLGADLVKVYPLPPVGGPTYLSTIRGPLGDIRMLAAGGFGVEEIPAYRQAGAVAFGIGTPLLGSSDEETHQRIRRGLALARGEDPS